MDSLTTANVMRHDINDLCDIEEAFACAKTMLRSRKLRLITHHVIVSSGTAGLRRSQSTPVVPFPGELYLGCELGSHNPDLTLSSWFAIAMMK